MMRHSIYQWNTTDAGSDRQISLTLQGALNPTQLEEEIFSDDDNWRDLLLFFAAQSLDPPTNSHLRPNDYPADADDKIAVAAFFSGIANGELPPIEEAFGEPGVTNPRFYFLAPARHEDIFLHGKGMPLGIGSMANSLRREKSELLNLLTVRSGRKR